MPSQEPACLAFSRFGRCFGGWLVTAVFLPSGLADGSAGGELRFSVSCEKNGQLQVASIERFLKEGREFCVYMIPHSGLDKEDSLIVPLEQGEDNGSILLLETGDPNKYRNVTFTVSAFSVVLLRYVTCDLTPSLGDITNPL